ncbi:Winged helix DNA-binding domain-containing protein [Arthrobacter alpinus]|uniref:Winged helix DNA-binding domain-containing protein n=1 Tax=Arthrobacter alpinus TaxID=656366 RepID=A0A1H5F474_9MICC|nr:winged helix DNA-binding domain-containing protein [Arthrobacter alpinus]SED98205.1 Winged helix DNA-binding domain-containing protein [Arthrobacter alpinus]
MPTTLSVEDALAVRMHRHGLWSPLAASAGTVVERFVAMQAQEYAYALWATAQRRVPQYAALEDGAQQHAVPGAAGNSAADLASAVDRGEILRTHVLRPTWHFVAPADARWLLALTSPHIHRGNELYYRKAGLDAVTLARVHQVLSAELAGGRHRTRVQLQAALAAAGVEASGLRLTYAMMHAELEQLVISGTSMGKQRSYALFDERVPAGPNPDRASTLKLLAERFLATRGPVSIKDFAVWSGLPMADVRRGVASAVEDSPGRFEQVTVDGLQLWWEPGLTPSLAPSRPRVDLIQGYDEYVMSYFESKYLLFTPSAQRQKPAAALYHSVLIDSLLAATWRHVITAATAVIQIAPLRSLSPAEAAAVEAAVVDYGHFMGRPTVTEWLLP